MSFAEEEMKEEEVMMLLLLVDKVDTLSRVLISVSIVCPNSIVSVCRSLSFTFVCRE